MNHKVYINKRRAFTAVEMLVAVTVFSMLIFGVYQLQNSVLATYRISDFKSESQLKLNMGLKKIRENIEKATYPSKIFADGTMIFGSVEPNKFDYNLLKPTKDLNNGGITGLETFYLRYKPCANDVALKTPTSPTTIISFHICNPIYSEKDNIMTKSDVATFAIDKSGFKNLVEIIWRPKTDTIPYRALQCRMTGDTEPKDFITHVTEVLIKAKNITPPGEIGEHYSIYNVHSEISIKVTLSSSTDGSIKRAAGNDSNLIITDEIKARCQVHAVGNL